MKYIDADKLKKIVEQAKQRALKGVEVDDDMYCDGRADAFGEVLLEIDSLQQEQPEVDLEKEIKFFLTNAIKMNKGQWRGEYHIGEIGIRAIAHRFYELGLNARKEE